MPIWKVVSIDRMHETRTNKIENDMKIIMLQSSCFVAFCLRQQLPHLSHLVHFNAGKLERIMKWIDGKRESWRRPRKNFVQSQLFSSLLLKWIYRRIKIKKETNELNTNVINIIRYRNTKMASIQLKFDFDIYNNDDDDAYIRWIWYDNKRIRESVISYPFWTRSNKCAIRIAVIFL